MNRLIVIALLLAAFSLSAQTNHRVSRIDVRGDVPARIVVSQSALAEGRSYSDSDLEVAVARVRRLPFVYDARYSMEGETLILEVSGMTRLFGNVDASSIGVEGEHSSSAAFTGGGRLFLGAGVAEGRVQETVAEHADEQTSADVEYSHYGIGGTRLFATAGVQYAITRPDGFDPDPALRLFVGYPLSIRQTLTASASRSGYTTRQGFILLGAQDLHASATQQNVDLRWTYDTTGDPFFARRGLTIAAGPSWSHSDNESETFALRFPSFTFGIETFRTESTSKSLSAEARKLWSVGPRGAIFSGVRGAIDRSRVKSSFGDRFALGVDSRYEARSGAITLGYAHNLFDRARATAMRQRIELGATYSRTELEDVFTFEPYNPSVTTVSAAYLLRPQFATIRLSLSYVFQETPPAAAVPGPSPIPFP
ncbi:MAG TPA: hypothetical protein VKB93_05145 [Thermoanaerobaculia bacterium]|nr:hypothetical protein [Thermoanaerobaculia bacterium]